MSQTHVTLDTVQVDITPHNAMTVMDRFNDRSEAWSLVNCGRDHNAIRFDLDVEGNGGMMELTLRADGTWTATTHIVVGEKSDG